MDIKKKWHLWKPALIIKNTEYPMGLCCNEVYAGLVVRERHLFPVDLLSAVFILAHSKENHFSDANHMQFLRRLEWTETAYLFFFKNDPVEKELKVLICIIYAKLFKAVEGKILQSTKKWDSVECNPNFTAMKSISKIFYCCGKTSCSAIPQIHRYQGWR